MTTRRTWVPLFFWLLDIAIVNSFLLYKKAKASDEITHSAFRLQLAWDLINLASSMQLEIQHKMTRKRVRQQEDDEQPLSKNPRVTKNSTDFSPSRLILGDQHLPKFQDQRQACIWCRILSKAGQIMIDKKCPPRSNIYCQTCKAVLCLTRERNCFAEYHTRKIAG
ncbi:hypothetical protein BC936DRAFT_137299 [Jimgerdemannia flammicorona]|uniref:PiggyBac transposable element-derived protein 4 C-terminal zinc-ribbon domain-containing protein n=1 Tax=Jimgerdemannia flammicorona TaxID=994334 RepID=A0A433CXP8_9FUNG|nr:hypothetical protein BC936DRAFT_137299 [Jimgerdemannia flammicorona]